MNSIHWVAVYTDGTVLPQYNEDDSENSYKDVDRHRLQSFAIFDGDHPVVRYHFDQPGLKLIYRRRTWKRSDVDGETAFFLVGWQKTVAGESLQSISVVGRLPDGTASVEVISKWHENHFLFDSIEPVEWEVPCGQTNLPV